MTLQEGLWFVIGGGLGACLTGLLLNRRYGQVLKMIDAQLKAIIAEHDEIVRGLIERIRGMEREQ